MKHGKRFVAVGVSMVILVSILAGCGSNTAEVQSLKDQVAGLTKQNDVLKKQVSGMSVTEVTPDSSLKTIDGSSIPTFQSIDGKINFPNKLTLPTSKDDVNNSNVMVGSKFKFTPSNNWIVKMNGATMDVNHPSNILGSIKAITVKDPVPEANMQGILQGFFKDFPSTTIKYRKVFLDDKVAGMIASAPITVDKKAYIVNVGFFTRSENGALLLFGYEDNKSGVQQELIDLLISSGTYNDSKIKLE